MTQRQYFVAGDSKTLITLNYVTRLCATGKTRASFLQASTSLHQHCHLLLFLPSFLPCLLVKKHEAPTHVHTCNQPYITCHLPFVVLLFSAMLAIATISLLQGCTVLCCKYSHNILQSRFVWLSFYVCVCVEGDLHSLERVCAAVLRSLVFCAGAFEK